MEPRLLAGQLIVVRTRFFRVRPGDLVVIRHNELEKIKRVHDITLETVEVRGDNPDHSTDSRHFGRLPRASIVGKATKLPCQK